MGTNMSTTGSHALDLTPEACSSCVVKRQGASCKHRLDNFSCTTPMCQQPLGMAAISTYYKTSDVAVYAAPRLERP